MSWCPQPASTEADELEMINREKKLAHPERFELPTTWFVARYSIQLSYGCEGGYYREGRGSGQENRSCSAVVRRFRRMR